MCLALPGEVVAITRGDAPLPQARVRFGDVIREVSLALVPEAGVGDFVLVHAGVAIRCVSVAEAEAIEALLVAAIGCESATPAHGR